MANKITNTDNYTAIANAIRSKNGSSDTYTPSQMATAISNIQTGGVPVGTKCAYVSTDSMADLVTEINKISSSYTNMDYMFYQDNQVSYGSMFPVNQINTLDVSNVTSMKNMWVHVAFDGLDLSDWDVSNVTNMYYTFSSFVNYDFVTLGIADWDVSSVTNMEGMFKYFQQPTTMDLSSWNVSSVTTMKEMFRGVSGLTSLNLSGWNTASVTDMSGMFNGLSSLQSLDIRNFNFANVSSYGNIFLSVPSNCLITVKDQTAKDWVLARRSDFTNVVIA